MTPRATPNASAPAPAAQQFLLILRRRWRILLAVFLAVTGGTAAWTFTQQKQYRPQATLEIRPERAVVTSSDDPALNAAGSMWENYYRTQENILTNPSLVEETLRALPPAIRAEFESLPDPVRALTEKIDIEQVRASFVLKVGVVDADPEMATQITNTLVSLYIEDANRRMRDVKSSAVEALSKETLPGIRKRMEDAGKDSLEFRKANGFIDFQEQYLTLVESWRKMKAGLVDAKLRRVKIETELEALKRYRTEGDSGAFHPTLSQTGPLERLLQEQDALIEQIAAVELRYKELHPRLRALRAELAAVEKRITKAVEGALVALETSVMAVRGEETAIDVELKLTEEAVADAGGRLEEYKRLDAELVGAKELYASWLKRTGETTATAGTGVSSVRVIDQARVPSRPWKPRIPLNLALGALLGLMLGSAAMLVVDQVDNRILSADEVEAFLGIEVLTVVPRLSIEGGEAPLLLGDTSALAEFEAFRGLRAEVLTRMEKQPGAKVLAILSPLQSEGKTTVTLNLSRAMAMDGKRVLLIDADMRKPKLRDFLEQREGPGLDEVLSGQAVLRDAARPSKIPGVDIVGVREGTSAAAELASSPAFDALLRDARAGWDFVIVDNAPVMQASESPLIARRADAAVLVIREGRTARGVARAAVRRLSSMGVRLLGAALNCASPVGRGYGYGYGYSYGEQGGKKKGARA